LDLNQQKEEIFVSGENAGFEVGECILMKNGEDGLFITTGVITQWA